VFTEISFHNSIVISTSVTRIGLPASKRKIQPRRTTRPRAEEAFNYNIIVPDVLLSSSPCRNHQAIIISFVDKDSTSAGSNNMLPVVTFHDVVLILDFE
jgi:hypothetical protein